MQRAPTLVFLVHRHAAQPTLRAFSTHPALLSKASKDRRVKWTRPASKATTNPGQAGTDAARAGAPTTGGGLFEGEQDVTPDAIERDMLAVQGEVRRQVGNGKERENLAGTDVGAGGQPSVQPSPPPSSSGSKGPEEQASVEGPGELIYTSTPPFNVPLMLSVSFVMSVFCLACADFAWTGIELYDEETGTYEVTPAWKRYTLAGSAATVGVGIAVWGSLAPTRLITRMTLHRTAGSMHSPLPFPRDSTNPLTPLLRKIGQKPRAVPLARIRLLGPISASAKPYHPLTQAEPSKPPGRLSTLLRPLRKKLLAPPANKPQPTPWNNKRLSHSPFVIEGDRASYSLAVKRAPEPFSDKGAWCKDWDALERALLGVDETKWTSR
ncbi:hypothetical protein DMC30DRAFT_415435 [Rhodotorula diobovata]|uniref:Uncharacterized protein n=1 Tax=Rhodotorula diobovata TaxID=5288 RepID=A0A5C5G0L6_9BASI|nr:hypothetical protein DMC30DRAFT_415435 [Rhodotorula diobovata]